MGAGGIINQRAAVLITGLTASCYLDFMEESDRARVGSIAAKGALACDEGDVRYMARLQKDLTCRTP